MVINGRPHGPLKATTTCQLHMRTFKDGDTILIAKDAADAAFDAASCILRDGIYIEIRSTMFRVTVFCLRS